MKKIGLPEFTIFSAQESHIEADLFSLETRLAPLLDLLRNKNTSASMAIALSGAPGMGRTSALQWLDARLANWSALSKKERGGHPCTKTQWLCPSRLQEPDAEKNLFTEWKTFLEKEKGQHLIVLIDDLETSSPECVEMFFALLEKSIRSLTGIFFVAAFHYPALQCVIDAQYADRFDPPACRWLLDRLFSLKCRLAPSPEQARRFLHIQMGQMSAFKNFPKAVYAEYIEEALMQVSDGNPAKIKRCLIQSEAAAFSAQHTQGEELRLRMVQGIQTELLVCWLERMGREFSSSMCDWLAALSEEAQNPYSDYNWVLNQQMEEQNKKNNPPTMYGTQAANPSEPPEGMTFKMIDEWLWNLLKIPFSPHSTHRSVEAASHATHDMPEEEPLQESFDETSLLEKISPELQSLLPEALKVPGATLSEELTAEIKSLNLADVELSAADRQLLRQLKNLERLDLHNSIGMNQLNWMVDLKNLKVLNLSCTPVSDISALSGLIALETLDLSYTQVEDLSPLAQVEELKALILYGAPVKKLAPLEKLVHLERLNLSHTPIEGEELVHLEKLTQLRHLFLRETTIPKERLLALQHTLNFDVEIAV